MERLKQRFGWSAARFVAVMTVSALLVIALWSPAGAHTGTTTHLWSTHIKPMGEPGTINATSNPVHWTKLKGVPASIADGADDDFPTTHKTSLVSTGLICNSGCNEGSVGLAAGQWVVFAKIVVLQTDIYEDDMFVRCELRVGENEIDTTWLDISSNYAGRGVIYLQGMVGVPSSGSVAVWCADDSVGDVEGENLSIIAIKVNP